MKTTISSKGQIVLPAEFREMDRIQPGQEFNVERLDRGDYRLVRLIRRHYFGLLPQPFFPPQLFLSLLADLEPAV